MEDDGIRGQYNDTNRAFLQAFMARGTLTFPEAQSILAAIFSINEDQRTLPGQVTQVDFSSYLSAASEAVSAFDLEVRSINDQVTKERIYALVNTTSDPMAQIATLHTAEEIAFVKRVIDAMFEKYNSRRMEVMALDEMQANKLRGAPRPVDAADNDESLAPQTQTLKGLKSSEAETMMRTMVDEGWFDRSDIGLYSLSPRALMELRSWLVESYNDPDAGEDEWQRVKFCEACKEIVTVGQRCSERDCNARLHDICVEAFWRTRRDSKCPKCSREWTGNHFVGQRAVTETEAYQRGRRRSGHGGGRRSNLVEHIMHDADEEAQDGEGEDGENMEE